MIEASESPILEIENLKIEFHTAEGVVHAVNGLNYRLYKGERLGIVGESGSGKSVSSLATMGLITSPPGVIRDGTIFFEGKDVLKMSEKELTGLRGNRIAMIFQESMTSLNPIRTCGSQIAEVYRLHQKMKKKNAKAAAIQMMKLVGIPNAEDRYQQYPHQMSGGMRQRVVIAMALACRPDILIADEPTTALDVTIQAQILDLIRDINRELGTSLIFISHDLSVICEICEHILVMYAGTIVEEADTDILFQNPQHPYTKGLLSAIPVMDRERKPLETIPGTVVNNMQSIVGCPFAARCSCAEEICFKEEPPRTGADGHFVKCWLNTEKQESAHAGRSEPSGSKRPEGLF